MYKKRIVAIEYIRGIAMLGVVGIHTGSSALSNPLANIHLVALLEIVTRFSVPIFFFVSAFGLFWSQDLSRPLDYKNYFKHRLRSVFIPYLVWSMFYMIHTTLLMGNFLVWHPSILIQTLFFGLASYHIYWLVILLWFYLLMPLWRYLLKKILAQSLLWLTILLFAQIIFDYYSSYKINVTNPPSSLFELFLQYRLNYWVLHYVFIFLFGGYCAQNYEAVRKWTSRHISVITISFISSLSAMLGFYYFLLFTIHYTPEEAVNTAHQLSPIGILYTLASSLFFIMWFESYSLPKSLGKLLSELSKYSYPVYLVHPFFLYYLSLLLGQLNLLFTGPVTLCCYLLVVAISLVFGRAIKALSRPYPILGQLLTGSHK
ncbi:peptidoglycan/LPS O-acetylase OafA/YrhL [Sporomusaceae bacterium BoRhaA]|uniref:acyltransferase n=1 Tax=Pelorhabdus rhamnosifermentans TaxID=2772457 RepID=UPI001C0646CB|nr:acyltransferase [Pelorhabdus rhamnosifermentans]MBU2702497.1 peptidoglycan/LPS O-acetylase OafA/YrhL [Pelorhabdus rhamnosifermentans]